MTNEQRETLVQAELLMMEIDYDLDRWRRELDQYEYWLAVNEADKRIHPTGKELVPVEYPLAWYEDGTRFVIGKAYYDSATGRVDGVLDGAALRGLRIHDLLAAHSRDYSIRGTVDITNPHYPDYQVVHKDSLRTMRVVPGMSIAEVERSWKKENKNLFIEEFEKFGAVFRRKRGDS